MLLNFNEKREQFFNQSGTNAEALVDVHRMKH